MVHPLHLLVPLSPTAALRQVLPPVHETAPQVAEGQPPPAPRRAHAVRPLPQGRRAHARPGPAVLEVRICQRQSGCRQGMFISGGTRLSYDMKLKLVLELLVNI